MIDYTALRAKLYAGRGCKICAAALEEGTVPVEHHPREVVNIIACRIDGRIEPIGWRISVRDSQRIIEFTSPHGGLAWYSYYADSLEQRFAQHPSARELVLCDGLGGYQRVSVNATTVARILAEFSPSHPMFAAAP